MKQKSRKYSGFTLMELILSVVIIWLIMPAMFSLYNFIIKSNREIIARQSTIHQWYEFFERLNILMQDYTVDYEEYYNRQMVGCVWTEHRWNGDDGFEWNVDKNWYCTEFTAYGNKNSQFTDYKSWYQDIYYCTSWKKTMEGLWVKVVKADKCGTIWTQQSYGQYKALFTDVHGWDWIIWDDDDEELWYLLNPNVDAIRDANNIQELYLISHDGESRLYFRRKLDKEYEEEKSENKEKYKQYKIQMLRLKWFDAWRMHNFWITKDKTTWITNEWLYDGIIDTWACDHSMWFDPVEAHQDPIRSVWWAYSDYYLPQDSDDCWIDLTYWNTNILARNISISPLWEADLYWKKPERQINAYMKIMTINWVYFPGLFNNTRSISNFQVPLETTINMKDFYREYSR